MAKRHKDHPSVCGSHYDFYTKMTKVFHFFQQKLKIFLAISAQKQEFFKKIFWPNAKVFLNYDDFITFFCP